VCGAAGSLGRVQVQVQGGAQNLVQMLMQGTTAASTIRAAAWAASLGAAARFTSSPRRRPRPMHAPHSSSIKIMGTVPAAAGSGSRKTSATTTTMMMIIMTMMMMMMAVMSMRVQAQGPRCPCRLPRCPPCGGPSRPTPTTREGKCCPVQCLLFLVWVPRVDVKSARFVHMY
jgi:hypothetical protein